jgi:hypothetical protein
VGHEKESLSLVGGSDVGGFEESTKDAVTAPFEVTDNNVQPF